MANLCDLEDHGSCDCHGGSKDDAIVHKLVEIACDLVLFKLTIFVNEVWKTGRGGGSLKLPLDSTHSYHAKNMIRSKEISIIPYI